MQTKRLNLKLSAVFLAAVALAACSHAPAPAPKPIALYQPTPLSPTPLTPPQPVAKPKPPRLALRHDPAPVAPVLAPPATAIAVIGLSQDDARKTFGEPKERIDQGPGQAWIYKNPRCTVEILFFLDVTRNGYYALDRKISGTDGSPASESTCLSDIQNARQ